MTLFGCWTKILNDVILRLFQAYTRELSAQFLYSGFQFVPDPDGDILGGWNLAMQEINLEVQVPVVHPLEDFFVDQPADMPEVNNQPGGGIGLTLNGHKKGIIVPVPVRVRALAEYLEILFIGQLRQEQPVCGTEMLAADDVYHRVELVRQR